MPKIGGNTLEECMEICMSDPKTKSEYPDNSKRSQVCYAACARSQETDSKETELDLLKRLIKKYTNK
jgi:hypothetical protein